MSRIGCPEGVKLLVTDGWENAHEDAPAGVYTCNVVYTKVCNMIMQTLKLNRVFEVAGVA
jgi:hypothetical protein